MDDEETTPLTENSTSMLVADEDEDFQKDGYSPKADNVREAKETSDKDFLAKTEEEWQPTTYLLKHEIVPTNPKSLGRTAQVKKKERS